MKKLFLVLALIAATATTALAQRAAEASVWSDDNDINHSGFFFNPIIGAMVGDVPTSFGYGFEGGYRYHFASGVNWDILTVGLNTCSESFEDYASVRLLTGVRYNTPNILAGKSMYFNFNLGYQINTKHDYMSGFAYGLGLGVNLTRLVSLGFTWEGNTADSANWGIFGAKVGFNF